MQLFVFWLMMLATAAVRVPVKGFLEGICHILYQSMASQKQSVKKITLFVFKPWKSENVYRKCGMTV